MSKLDDIHQVRKTGATAVVIGKALYEGAFTLEEALAAAVEKRNEKRK
jgi:phosphoribosylformimino-5-aminoimidazole carboxamide ribotide isomerase